VSLMLTLPVRLLGVVPVVTVTVKVTTSTPKEDGFGLDVTVVTVALAGSASPTRVRVTGEFAVALASVIVPVTGLPDVVGANTAPTMQLASTDKSGGPAMQVVVGVSSAVFVPAVIVVRSRARLPSFSIVAGIGVGFNSCGMGVVKSSASELPWIWRTIMLCASAM